MKKSFKLTDPKKAPARQVEYVKHEINKYLARERRKKPAEGADYWDFDVKFGLAPEKTEEIHIASINKNIDRVVLENADSFYIEIMAKPGFRMKKPKDQSV